MRKIKFLTIPVLALVLFGCEASQWVKVAQQILPVVLPMVTNLVSAVSLLQGKTVSAADVNMINQTASQVSNDLNLAAQLINQYQTSPNVTILQRLNTALEEVHTNLSSLLPALHIADPATIQKIAAIVMLVDNEVNSLQQVLPAVSGGKLSARPGVTGAPLSADQLKAQFDAIVAQPTGNAEVNQAFAKVALK